MITPMHGHMAFFGAYVMIVLAMVTYAAPGLFGHEPEQRETPAGLWAFWLQVGGMFGMTMAFAAAGISTDLSGADPRTRATWRPSAKIQVHFLMLVGDRHPVYGSAWGSSCTTSSSSRPARRSRRGAVAGRAAGAGGGVSR